MADVKLISFCEGEFKFGGQCAFDVQVEFEFGEVVDEGVHRGRLIGGRLLFLCRR